MRPWANSSQAMADMAALSVHRARGGDDHREAVGAGRFVQAFAKAGVGGDAPTDTQRPAPAAVERLPALGDEHVHDGFLKTGGQVGDVLWREGRRVVVLRRRAGDFVEHRRFQAAEAEFEARRRL